MSHVFIALKKIILASGSPRRQDFLNQLGVEFQVDCRTVDETPLQDEAPEPYVRRLALAKAQAVAAAYPEDVVLSGDTAVICQGQILGKPESDVHHLQMLQQLSAAPHQVMTGFAVLTPTENVVELVTSQVRFHTFSDRVLQGYIASGDGRDKAGGYGIQSAGAFLVRDIQGSFSNVIGLPMTELVQVLLTVGAIQPL